MKRFRLRSKLYPRGLLLNPETPYVPAGATDVARTFARARARIEAEKRRVERETNITPIKRKETA